jgi:hypothetical protein
LKEIIDDPAAAPGALNDVLQEVTPVRTASCSGVDAAMLDIAVELPGYSGAPFRRHGTARKVPVMSHEDDGELMLRYANGDMRAFETLYHHHRNTLYRYLARHARDPDVANDLFQEVWSKVIASRGRYEPREKFSTFL